MVARKAIWVLRGDAGVRTLKIKIGRAKWMGDPEKALHRDIAVVRAVRRSVGSDVRLFVDGNNGYLPRPLDALRFAEAVADARVYAMEEMFPEEKPGRHRQVKEGMRTAGVPTKLADGEGHRDGIPHELMNERIQIDGHDVPLFDINQPDMNANGLVRMAELAARSRRFGLSVAPHNFASKMGFYSQVHLGLVTPNWEFSEVDDSEFPGIQSPGIEVREGKATVKASSGLGISIDEAHLEAPLLDLRGGSS